MASSLFQSRKFTRHRFDCNQTFCSICILLPHGLVERFLDLNILSHSVGSHIEVFLPSFIPLCILATGEGATVGEGQRAGHQWSAFTGDAAIGFDQGVQNCLIP